ncbi:MAG: coenzyme F390 synthetase [Candidatus Binatia bacterium]|nr:MAG: coenzyme F390 synthetase [Candidatus Binatia bacterium]
MTTATGPLDDLGARTETLVAARIPHHLERLQWTPDRLERHQRDALRTLLAHALRCSPFHARRLSGVDPEGFELGDLPSLPPMTKGEMMEHFDEVTTDRRLDRATVEAHLAAASQEPTLLFDRYVCLTSGGSSGIRGIFLQTIEEHVEFACSISRRSLARLMALGGPPPGGFVLAMVAAASPVHATGFGAATSKSGPMRIVSVPATLPICEAVARLNDIQPHALMGYPTRLEALAAEQRAGRLRITPFAVTTTGEVLTPSARAAIADAFGVPPVDQFASTEGLVGHSEPGESVLTFATDNCLVELVDADGRPVPPGVPSEGILVTNLYNLTQPLIRYEITDRFVRHPDSPEGYLRASVEGRADEVFRYGSVEIHPIVVRTVMVKTPAVSEYRVHQTPRGIDMEVVASESLDTETLAANLCASLRDAGLRDPLATVRCVEGIERNPLTGKVRRFVPLCLVVP